MFYAWKSHISDDSALGRHASGVPWPDGLEARCPPDDLGEDPSYSALLLTQYLDYVRNCPGVFESLAGVFEVDLVVPQPSHGRDDIATTVPSLISDNSYVNISTCDSSGTAPHGSLSHPLSVPSLSNLGTSYAHDCVCTHCGKEFDRHTRARDCRNRDLGLTPHKCLGRCGVVGWLAKSSSCVRYVLNPNVYLAPCPMDPKPFCSSTSTLARCGAPGGE